VHTMRPSLRRFATMTVSAVTLNAVLCAYASNLLVPTQPLPKPAAHYAVMPVASIDESNETIGIADSDMYDPKLTEADIIARFEAMQSLGVDTIRVMVPWGVIQAAEPGSEWEPYFPEDWSRLDFIVEQAMSRDMAVLGVINATPYYGGQNNTGCLGCYGVAPDAEEFAAFAGEAALRYKGQISAYEVWNEPNLFAAWMPGPDPAAYTNLLKATHDAIKGAYDDPEVADPLVVAGVLTAVTNFMPFTMDARTFVAQMYANGAKDYFDALSFHPYQYTTKFSDGEYDPNVNPHEPWKADSPLEMLLSIRQTMIDNGDEDLRIWATEYGLPTGGPTAVTPEHQAEFIKDFLETWREVKDANGDEFTGPAFLYTIIDRMDGTEEGSIGLYTKDAAGNWVRKPAADVVEELIKAPEAQPEPLPEPEPVPDPNQAFNDALAALYEAMAIAYANAIAQALADMFAAFFNPQPVADPVTPMALAPAETVVATMPEAESIANTAVTQAPEAAGAAAASGTPNPLEPVESADVGNSGAPGEAPVLNRTESAVEVGAVAPAVVAAPNEPRAVVGEAVNAAPAPGLTAPVAAKPTAPAAAKNESPRGSAGATAAPANKRKPSPPVRAAAVGNPRVAKKPEAKKPEATSASEPGGRGSFGTPPTAAKRAAVSSSSGVSARNTRDAVSRAAASSPAGARGGKGGRG
jgi:hypothetical protein